MAKIADQASRWLRENRFEPFFLLVHTYEVHHPYTNPEGFADAYLDPGYDGELTQEVLPTQIHGRESSPVSLKYCAIPTPGCCSSFRGGLSAAS